MKYPPEWSLPHFACHEFAPKKQKYCVCIPVINEGERIQRQLSEMQNHALSQWVDVILCDGGSTDGSLQDMHALRTMGVRTLLIKQDLGKLGAQLRMGYAYAMQQGYAGVITVDGNGKDGVEALPRFVESLDAGWDFVQGSRYMEGGAAIRTPRMRSWAVKCLHIPMISLAARFRYTDTTNGFRAYSRRFLLHSDVQPFRSVFDTYELLAYLSIQAPRLGFRVKELPVRRSYPETGKTPTKISPIRGNWQLLRILLLAVLGKYCPPQRT